MFKKRDLFLKLKQKLLESCLICNKTGWKDTGEMCDCLKKFEYYLDLDDAGIDKEYWDLTVENWESDGVALSKVEEYIDSLDIAYENGFGLVFSGSNGTGKTLLSSFILKEALKLGRTIRFITMGEVRDLMLRKISDPIALSFFDVKVKSVDFLCLDNLGSEYVPQRLGQNGPYILSEFDILARYRKRNLMPTILTTNLSEQAFIEQYGSSISSLFRGCSSFIEVKGSDFRPKQAKKIESKIKRKR